MANCDRHPGVSACLCLLVKIVCENAWLVHIIRHLRRRFAHTIATQQEMEISLRLFPFPTVLSTIYRLRRNSRFPISGLLFSHKAGVAVIIRHLRRRFAHTIATQQEMEISLRSFPFPTVLSTIYRLRRIPNLRIPDSQFPISGY